MGKFFNKIKYNAGMLKDKLIAIRDVDKTGKRIAGNALGNFWDEKIKNAGFKSDIKRTFVKIKTLIIEIVKNLHKDLTKDAIKQGKKEIRQNKREKVKKTLLPNTAKVVKAEPANLIADLNKATQGKGKSNAIISGTRNNLSKNLENPMR